MSASDSVLVLLDRFAWHRVVSVGMALACTGLALLALNTLLQADGLWFACFACLGASGPGVFFSVLFLSEKHPQLQSLISTLASATFDGSALCFYLWNALYFRGSISLATIAVLWLVLSVALAGATVVQLPSWGWLKQERKRTDVPPERNASLTDDERGAVESAMEAACAVAATAAVSEEAEANYHPERERSRDKACSRDGHRDGYTTPPRRTHAGPAAAANHGAPSAAGGDGSNRSAGGADPLAEPLIMAEHQSSPLASPPGTPADPFSRVLRSSYYGSEAVVMADAEESIHRGGCYSDGCYEPLRLDNVPASLLPEVTPSRVTPPPTPIPTSVPVASPSSIASAKGTTGLSAPRPTTAPSDSTSAPPRKLSSSSGVNTSGGSAVGGSGSGHRGSGSGGGGGGGSSSRSLPQVFFRSDTILLICTMTVVNLKASYYIVSFSDAARSIFDEDTAQLLDSIFNLGFPLGALTMSPLASMLLRRYRKRPDVYMSVALAGVHAFGLCTLIPHAVPQAMGAVLFGPSRTLLWSSYFHFLSQPRRYPRALAGRTLGYSNLVIALASDVPPSLLKSAVGREDWIVHWALQVLLLGCIAFPLKLRSERASRSNQ